MNTPPGQDDETEALTAPRVPHPLDYIGLAATFAPFMISFRSSNSSSMTTTVIDENGNKQSTTVESSRFRDPVAIGGGALGIVTALATLLLWRKTLRSKRALRIGLTLGVLALGAIQLVIRGGLLTC